jgi:hypothetical protein
MYISHLLLIAGATGSTDCNICDLLFSGAMCASQSNPAPEPQSNPAPEPQNLHALADKGAQPVLKHTATYLHKAFLQGVPGPMYSVGLHVPAALAEKEAQLVKQAAICVAHTQEQPTTYPKSYKAPCVVFLCMCRLQWLRTGLG